MADQQAPSSADAKSNTKAIIAIILSIVALAFVFSNVGPATLRFLFLQFTMPTWAWFLVVLLAGVVIGSLFPWFRPKKK
ncbi:MAG: LapA family protein [Microbacteriaceae bacterium]|nr:LapA family protein [Microbacteriaceae bacterium]